MSQDFDTITVLLGPSEKAANIDKTRTMRQTILDTIGAANESLIIVGYMLNSEEIVDRIIGLDPRVEVIVHLDERQTKGDRRAMASAKRLRENGAMVNLHGANFRGSMHAKVIIADDREAIVGSANLTYSGADRNLEIGLQLRGPSVSILKNAVEYTFEG